MTELVFYTNPRSRGRMVRWMLEEVGAPYRTEILDYATSMKADAFRKLNPMLKVPVITHGDVVVSEVAAICAYLADAFPEAGLAPAPSDRGAYYRWLFFAAGCVEPAMTNASLGFVPPPERRAMVGYASTPETLDALETAVDGREFIAGDRFSATDLYVTSQIGFGLAFGMITDRPTLATYAARHRDRPAAIRAREIDDALLPQEMRGKM
ncbi:glutathione S-transferase family protein [Glacieibacterium megasporae]|uniref:glutathione S-transferase family protein n=1 Tax=Glacieibacterium megasporae TaxID=2835787 RepID=UPI001C1E829F|nr:glutathione S-transferase family protein [Polymorphobacter megasporae]UAJ09991.1 glutathione S-transferase family protein [Polymorphobacter megasporae]